MGFKRPFYGQRIKQTSGQELVLPRGRLRETNRALEECHAYIRLIPVGGEADRCRGTGLDGEDSGAVQVRVEWVAAPAHTYHSDLNEVNANYKEGGAVSVRLWADCFRITAAVCGGDMDVIGNDTEDGILALVRGKTLHAVNKIPGENVNIASRLASAVVMRIAELVYDRTNSGKERPRQGLGLGSGPGSNVLKVGKPGILQAISGFEKGQLKHVQTSVRTLGCVDGKGQEVVVHDEKLQRAWDIYGVRYLKRRQGQGDEKGLKSPVAFAEELGVNEHCKPKPGEMLVTVPATFAKSWGRFVESNYNPNFHFAPCVLVDEEENIVVTLENWSVNDHLTYNDKWAFCIYSLTPRSDGSLQTYHEALTETGGYGNIALTFCARFTP